MQWLVRNWHIKSTMKPSVKLKCLAVLIALCVLLIWINQAGYSHWQKQEVKSAVMSPTPPMGWNSWNYFRCDGLNEAVVRGTADALVATGLTKSGYVYVNLDDCWQIDRNATGHIMEDRTRFPQGIKSLSDYLHGKGLKFGIYTDVGSLTCEKRPGSFNHEEKDVESYYRWDVDYIKNDDCWLYPGMSAEEHYAKFWTVLQKSPRQMIHSIKGSVPIESSAKYGQVRRVGGDVFEEWGSVVHQLDNAISGRVWETTRPGFWHDLDMLEVGNGHMSDDENVAHMIIWCAFKAPLLLGNDVRSVSASTLDLLMHDELIAVNQDSRGKSVHLAWWGEAPGGLRHERVISAKCNVSDPVQQWMYAKHRIQNVATGKCLGVKSVTDLLAVVKVCDSADKLQAWHINEESKQIELAGIPGKCLTTNIDKDVPNYVRGCTERQGIPYYRGPNQNWFYYNDAFEFITKDGSPDKLDGSTILIKNLADKCPKVGDKPELQVFTGPLSENRQVAVLLNRDEIHHSIQLRRDHFNGLGKSATVLLRDAYKREDLPDEMEDAQEFYLPPHSAKMIIANIVYKK